MKEFLEIPATTLYRLIKSDKSILNLYEEDIANGKKEIFKDKADGFYFAALSIKDSRYIAICDSFDEALQAFTRIKAA